MTQRPFQQGEFVWCNYPESERPARPGPRHVGYVVLSTASESENFVSAVIAYTSSQQWNGPTPPGVRRFSWEDAKALGQQRPFYLDLRRAAFLPMTVEWFPHLEEPGRGVLGRAPKKLRDELHETAMDLYTRHRDNVERLGRWPRR